MVVLRNWRSTMSARVTATIANPARTAMAIAITAVPFATTPKTRVPALGRGSGGYGPNSSASAPATTPMLVDSLTWCISTHRAHGCEAVDPGVVRHYMLLTGTSCREWRRGRRCHRRLDCLDLGDVAPGWLGRRVLGVHAVLRVAHIGQRRWGSLADLHARRANVLDQWARRVRHDRQRLIRQAGRCGVDPALFLACETVPARVVDREDRREGPQVDVAGDALRDLVVLVGIDEAVVRLQ